MKLKDEASTIQDSCIIELENKVDQLKIRISKLVNKKISENKISPDQRKEDMVQPIAINTINEILGYRQHITTYLQEICIYLDGLPIYNNNGGYVDILNHIGKLFNNITDNLNIIINCANIAHQDIRQYQAILDNTNTQV